jgi:hypothetical protein
MGRPTVFAVMKATIEIPVRSSESGETFEQMHTAAKMEAEGILRNLLTTNVRVIGDVKFLHAVVKVMP